jgi:hypothetical protein
LKLAIVIPYFKYTFFEATLQSLAVQTDKRFKVYIGNDASPKNPTALLQKYKSLLDFEYKEFEYNLGSKSLVKQWERCISMINDEHWLQILGDDDTLADNFVELFYKNLKDIDNKEIPVIRYATKIINEKDEIISDLFTHPAIETSVDFLFRRLNGGTRSSLSEYVFKLANVKKYGFKNLPLAWHADDLAVLEFSEFGPVFTITDSYLNFRISGKNITSFKHDMVIKNNATFDFYYYLLQHKKEHFNLSQQKILYSKLEKSLLNDKKNIFFWFKVSILYLSSLKLKGYYLLLNNAINQSVKSLKKKIV